MSPTSLAAISRTRTKDSREPHADDAIAIAVHDSGPGIDPKRIDGIFNSFITTKKKTATVEDE